ncbi:MAG TPA: class I SAM-dependent methyltransferase [Blastocatellia bacterium]|nr:class I SAM-dependent methyltransferase [Blastocatellia bacterium]
MNEAKELAYRYELFVTPGWRERFDILVDENIELPVEGRILDVNSGTGSHAIELAERLKNKGEVIGIDPDSERVALARAKALVKKADNVRFDQGNASDLSFESHEFDAVIGDASMLPEDQIEDVLEEMIRVALPEARVVLKLATRGSFDEFFSLYWEALHEAGIDDEAWAALEQLINERRTVSDAESMAVRAGLRNVESFVSKEEFSYDNADEFLESPLVRDYFLDRWLEVVPEDKRNEAQRHIVSTIERERHNAPFDVSIKAAIVTGVK